MNSFIANLQARTENGAVSYFSTGKELVDQFGKAASYRGRHYSIVADDQKRLWDENPAAAIKFPFYLRLITREVKVSENTRTEKVQRGAGARDEAFKRLLWLAYNHYEAFANNIWLLPVIGSWKDLWTLLVLDAELERKLDKSFIFSIIATGLSDDVQSNLIRKYMPAIKSAAKCKTDRARALNTLAKNFANYLGLSAKSYRKMKTEGTAHDFQKLICARKFNEIDFNTIPGKALLNLVSGKFLNNHALYNKYIEWIKAQPVAKFNGYPYELGAKLNIYGRRTTDLATKITIDKQFENLIATGKKDNGAITGNVWCALDTSGSMCCTLPGTNVTAMNICLSLGIYFSTLNEGAFHKNVIMFDSTSYVKQLKGSFTEMWDQVPSDAMGSTNFQSIVDEIVRIRTTRPNVPLEDYPQTILVVSDMQFNPSGTYQYNYHPSRIEEMTNIEAAKAKLKKVFPEEFVDKMKFVWWNVDSRATNDFPSTLEDGGSYFFSGFDGAIISFLLGGNAKAKEDGTPLSAEDIVNEALNQEIFSFIKS